MQISLRSHLIAGTAAVVGASAIAMTPVVAQHDLALPAIQAPAASASVLLAGFDSPITELLGSIFLANEYLTDTGAWAPFITAPWSAPSAVGVLPQIITDALPVVRQLGLNGSDYLYYGVGGLLDSASAVSEGVWNAIGDLATLDITGAINTLVASVQVAGATALAAGNYVLQGVITRATAVVNNLVPILSALPQAVIGQGLVAVGSVVKVVTDAVDALGQPNPIEGVWNAVVDGLFSQGGIPGALLSLTIGAGIPAGLSPTGNFVPSVRTVATSLVQAVATGLATPNPAPTPFAAVASAKSAAPEAPSAASLRSAAAEESTTPAADNTKSDEGSTGGSSATAGDNNNSGSASSDEGGSKGGGKSTGGSKRAHKAKSAD